MVILIFYNVLTEIDFFLTEQPFSLGYKLSEKATTDQKFIIKKIAKQMNFGLKSMNSL